MTDYWQRTRDHQEIIEWAEERSANAAKVVGVHPDVEDDSIEVEIGALRLSFYGYAGHEKLEPIMWDAFFEVFDEQGLTFVYRNVDDDGDPTNDYHLE